MVMARVMPGPAVCPAGLLLSGPRGQSSDARWEQGRRVVRVMLHCQCCVGSVQAQRVAPVGAAS
jgi:hypothetical protein